MPLYDYKCSSCGLVREHRQKFTDEALTECPECGGEYKRIITSVGVIFKGSGFHVNDYRPGTSTSSSSKEVKKDSPDKTGGDDSSSKKPPSESSSSSDSKGESKPASGGSSPDSPQGNKVA